MMHTPEFDSAEGCTPQSLTPRRDAHRRVGLCGGMHTPEFDSAEGCTPQSLTLRWDAQHGVANKLTYLGEIEEEFENTLACFLSGA